MGMKDLILDAWSSIAYKAPMRDDARARIAGWAPQSWMDEDHRRRLAAYMILAAYDQNSARVFLDGDDEDRDTAREYGDAGLIIDQTLAHLIGESLTVAVPGAEKYDPTMEDPGSQARKNASEEQIADNGKAKVLADRQDFLQTWAEGVHLELLVTDSERNAVAQGDAVYIVGWDTKRDRPTLAVMDPGFYFPVLPDTLDAYEYPEKVHFAWEVDGKHYPDGKTRLRRITYELGPIGFDIPANPDEEIQPRTRRYPWDEQPSETTCYLTDAEWVLDDVKDNLSSLSLADATFHVDGDGNPLDGFDLEIDFVPVVHIPNTPPGGEHYGKSSLARVLQILDDLSMADTDSHAASSTTGSPIIAISGDKVGTDPITGHSNQVQVKPGEVWKLGGNGRMDALDTSNNLREQREYVASLRDRLSQNSRLPAAVLGMLKPSEVPSGFAMQLSFGPLSSMIRQMRLVRGVKYPLLLKMVQRLYQANGVLPAGSTPRAEVQFGAYLPSDQAGTLEMVKSAYEAGLISLETAVAMLQEVGFPFDDVAEEIARIQARDYEGANRLADATNDQNAVREYLGLEPVKPSEVQPVSVPGVTDRNQPKGPVGTPPAKQQGNAA